VNGGENGWRSACRNSPINRARFFPLRQRKRRKLTLRSELGSVSLRVDYGLDRRTGQWLSPAPRAWGLRPHQKFTPGFAAKLCFTVTATGCYEEAAQVVGQWAGSMDDSTLHRLVQRMGEQAEEQRQERATHSPAERQPKRADSDLAVLMVDGWQVRHRGAGWGRKRTVKPRVEWHEMKTGVFYLQEQAAQTEGGRGLIEDKVVVSVVGEPLELGQRLHWEALRGGLGRARQQLFLGDGAAWIWNLKQDRWAKAMGLLDFFHASQHLWEVGRAVVGEEASGLLPWVEERLHQLRHGHEKKMLSAMAGLKKKRGAAGKVLAREQNYFASHAARMNYQDIARRGWPIGSGAVESACRQKQCRFKRPGQFWTPKGLRNLIALDEARRNHHWDQLWTSN
jgi:uncharacterized protein YlxP (DUF503 family)